MNGKKNKHTTEDFAFEKDRKKEVSKATPIAQEVIERDGLDIRL